MRRERGNNSVLEGDNPAETALIWLMGPAVLLYGAYLLAGFLAGRIHCGAPTKPDSLFAPLGFLVGEHDPAAFGATAQGCTATTGGAIGWLIGLGVLAIVLLGVAVLLLVTTVVVPLLLSSGYHVHVDIATAVGARADVVAAPALGPTISGAILARGSLHYLFVMMLPIIVVALVIGLLFMRNYTEPRAVRLDVLSVVLSAIGFGGVIYALASISAIVDGHARLVPLLAALLFGERAPLSTWLALPVAGAGLALLFLQHGLRPAPGQLFYVLAAGIFALFYILNTRAANERPGAPGGRGDKVTHAAKTTARTRRAPGNRPPRCRR